MCCRYFFDDETIREIRRVVQEVDADLNRVRTGDVHPADPGLLITGGRGNGKELHLEQMNWGFPGADPKQLLINARSETALEKRTFRESVLSRRCVIPAKAFYEWNAGKTKFTFEWEEHSVLYMAGFYNYFRQECRNAGGAGMDGFRYIVLTTAANASMEPVHDRMPLILPEEQIRDWIFDDGMAEEVLKQASPMLRRSAEYEQLSLFGPGGIGF